MGYCCYCDLKMYCGKCISAMDMEPYVCPHCSDTYDEVCRFAPPRTQSKCVKCVQHAFTDLQHYIKYGLRKEMNCNSLFKK